MNYKKVFLIAVLFTGCFSLYAAHAPGHAVTAPELPRCPFCFEEILPADSLIMHETVAGPHQAHRACAQPWFAMHDTCPLCRGHVDVHALFHGVVAGHIAAPVPAMADNRCHFCHQVLEDDPEMVVELPCHHRFHRLCAAHLLVDYTAFHYCPICHVLVDTIYDLFPAMRRRALMRHTRDAALLIGGGVVGCYLARPVVTGAVRSLFSDHWRLQDGFGMGILGGAGLGIGFALHTEPRSVYSRMADIFKVAFNGMTTRGRPGYDLHFTDDPRVMLPALSSFSLSLLVNLILSERRGTPGSRFTIFMGCTCGAALSAAVVFGVREMREVWRILASYWRSRH